MTDTTRLPRSSSFVRSTAGGPDLIIFTAIAALVGIGIVMVFSASHVVALSDLGDSYYYLKRQLLWAALGLFAMVVFTKTDYRRFQSLGFAGLAVSCILLVLVLLIGPEIGGSKRWIPLGFFRLQPSELVKIAMVNFVAAYAASIKGQMKSFFKGFLPVIVAAGLVFGLIMLEPDFGTAVAIFLTTLVMLFAAGARMLHLMMVGLMAIPAFGALVYMAPYRLRRILAFIDPWADPLDSGWNIIQSLLAIGSGGLFGLGLGQSREKFLYLPAPHTDFIFAILGEELGFLGTATVVILFFIVAWRGYRVALEAPDLYGCLLAVGITTMIVLQAMLNIGVVTGVLPVTGIPLPFISFGGSSLTISLASVGILLSISTGAGFKARVM